MKKSRIHKVALLTDGIFPFVTGGMQKHSYYLLRHLLENGVKVVLYHCAPDNEVFTTQLPESLRADLEEVLVPFPKSPAIPGSYLRDSKEYSASISHDLRHQVDIDYIYAQGFTAWRTLELKKEGLDLPPIGVNFHGLEMYQFAKGFKSKAIQRMFRPAVKANCILADVVYSLGGKLTDILRDLVPEDKIRTIPIGIERSWLREVQEISSGRRVKAAFIGRYERRKGIEELNTAMGRLADAPIDFHLIGPIVEDKRIEQESVTYHGKLTEEARIQGIFDECDILVVPSLAEGMPTVILEGMARGLAVVASDVGAVSEEVGEENGRLLKAGDVDRLEAAIREVMSLPIHKLVEMKLASRQKVEQHFLWERIIQLTLQQMNEDYI